MLKNDIAITPELVKEHGLKPEAVDSFAAFTAGASRLALTVSPLQGGFQCPPHFAFITESELYAGTPRRSHSCGSAAASQVRMA